MDTVFRLFQSLKWDGTNLQEAIDLMGLVSPGYPQWKLKEYRGTSIALEPDPPYDGIEIVFPLNTWCAGTPNEGIYEYGMSDEIFAMKYMTTEGYNAEGPSGPSGPAGPPGSAATIAVGTVTTGVPGSSASVVNAGTSSAAQLNFTLPRGDTGAAGPAGPSLLGAVSALIPAVTLLSVGTRELVVPWGETLPNNTYNVRFLRDNTLAVGSPYTFAVKPGSKTTTQFTLQYTNSAVLTLGSGVLHCLAS